jgi:hypothetical protein
MYAVRCTILRLCFCTLQVTTNYFPIDVCLFLLFFFFTSNLVKSLPTKKNLGNIASIYFFFKIGAIASYHAVCIVFGLCDVIKKNPGGTTLRNFP